VKHLLPFVLLCGVLAARASASPVTESIDAYCHGISIVTKNSFPLLFTQVKTDTDRSPLWTQNQEGALALIPQAQGFVSLRAAHVWTSNGKIAWVDIADTDAAGDGGQDAAYCYRPNGMLARIDARVASATFDVLDTETRYFDERGVAVARKSHLKDLQPKPRAKIPPEVKPWNPPVYSTLHALPFYQSVK
jgi:hypothetical protein